MTACVKNLCYDGLSNIQKYNGKLITGNAKKVEASSRVSESNLLKLDTDLFRISFRDYNCQDKDRTFLNFQIFLEMKGKAFLRALCVFLLLHLAYKVLPWTVFKCRSRGNIRML